MKHHKKFDRLLEAMATQPEPSERQQGDNQTSDKACGADAICLKYSIENILTTESN